jgi:hypothetical protein
MASIFRVKEEAACFCLISCLDYSSALKMEGGKIRPKRRYLSEVHEVTTPGVPSLQLFLCLSPGCPRQLTPLGADHVTYVSADRHFCHLSDVQNVFSVACLFVHLLPL